MTTIAGPEEISTSTILGHGWQLARGNGGRAMAALLALTAGGTLVDGGIVGEEFNLVVTFLFVGLQFWITLTLLDDLGLRHASGPRFGAFFVQGIVMGLGILAGFLFLVVPGIVLMVRWSIGAPVLISSDLGIAQSIGESWRQTADHFWPILFALLTVYGAAIVGAALGYFGSGAEVLPEPAGLVLANLAIAGGSVMAWHVAVAIFAMIARPAEVAGIFA